MFYLASYVVQGPLAWRIILRHWTHLVVVVCYFEKLPIVSSAFKALMFVWKLFVIQATLWTFLEKHGNTGCINFREVSRMNFQGFSKATQSLEKKDCLIWDLRHCIRHATLPRFRVFCFFLHGGKKKKGIFFLSFFKLVFFFRFFFVPNICLATTVYNYNHVK